jgi:hypothetical protein
VRSGRLSILAGIVLLATADSFYVDLLQRGIVDTRSGEYARAAEELRIAAFGLIDDVPRYQTAQVYLAVANSKLGRESAARAAAEKAASAERMAPSYQRLALDPAVRTQFDALLPKMVADAGVMVAKATPPKSPPPPTTVNRQPVTAAANAAAKISAPIAPVAPRIITPAPPPPAPKPVSPIMAAARHQPSESPAITNDIGPQLLSAQNLLNEGRILAARQTYLRLTLTENRNRAQILAIAKGLNDTSAWRESTDVYSHVAPLQRGEEIHMFAEAVNRYELGDLNSARALLQRALPGLPQTREIVLYRGKILGTP